MKSGEIIQNASTGETLVMLIGEGESEGTRQLYEVQLPPHRPSPPLHYHLQFTETFKVIQGELDMFLGKERIRQLLHPGESVTVAIRQPHTFANDRDEPVTFTVETIPAGGVVKAFQIAYGIANHGGAGQDGLPKNLIARLIFIKTSQGFLWGVPRILQRLMFAIASLVAAMTGLKKQLERYVD